MSDTVIVGIVTGVLNLLGLIVTSIVAYMMAKLKQGQDATAKEAKDTAVKVEEVKVALEDTNSATAAKLEQIAKVGEMTHDLSNSGALALKENLMITAEAKAEITHSKSDMAAAERAREGYEHHKSLQDKVTAAKDEPSKKTGMETHITSRVERTMDKVDKVVEKVDQAVNDAEKNK